MSVRTNPMKAVPVLLKRVKSTRAILDKRGSDDSLGGKLDQLARELSKIEDVFMKVKKNQDQLLDTLHEVDGHLRKLDRKRLDQDMDHFCKRIRDCAHKLLPMEAFEEDHKSSDDPSSSQHKKELLDMQDVDWYMIERLERPLPYLEFTLQCPLWFLSIFPEDAALKKRQAIYLWIGLGLIVRKEEKTAEEVGEEVFDELFKLKVIVPYGNAKCPIAIVNKFQIHPHIRPFLQREHAQHGSYMDSCLLLKQQHVVLALDSGRRYPVHSVLNVSSSYLNFGPQWLDKRCSLQVLQLGRWQDSPSHHIEVGNQDFLNNLRHQRALSYLSLRGISRVFELLPSIAQLENLQILDLKACHNLETLPDDISSLKNLTHLILSQCYLLDNMPKGIEKLTQLQVLKGFLIGSSRNTPCRISDLANLKNLRRLSIRIGSGAVIEDGEFESLGELAAVEHLKISWGVSRYSDIPIILPPILKKLHLECFPGQRISNCVSFERIKELHITGGKLESILVKVHTLGLLGSCGSSI